MQNAVLRAVSGCAVACCIAVVGSAEQSDAATVSLTPGTTFQTIEGIGAFAAQPYLNRRAGSFWVTRPGSYEIDRFITDLGASAIRFEVPPSVYPVEGQPYDWNGSVFGTGGMRETFRLMREYRARGADKFIFTVWSPPCWMKISGNCTGPREGSAGEGPMDNILKPDKYDALAAFLADFCQAVKDSAGIEPYGLSVQNEPYFHEPYNSCVYYEADLNTLVTKTRATLNAKTLGTRVFGAEHMFGNGTGYYGLMLDNAGLNAWAVHGYTDGVNPNYGTAAEWATMWGTVNGKGKKLWMTETTGGSNTQMTARTLHAALGSGNVSLWTWWTYADNLGTYGQTDGVNTSYIPNGTYWGTRHFARFARPGAQRIGCSSDQTTLWATAYKNSDNTYAVVLINTATTATTATISGAGLPTNWQRYESAGTLNCSHTGQVGSTNVAVPASGVVTLYSGSPVPVLPADTIASSVAAPTQSTTIGELNVFGDDTIDVYINGNKIQFSQSKSAIVTLVRGQNSIACKLVNGAWGGGMLASMLLPGNDTLRSGTAWKFTYKEPASTWTQTSFDHSSWYQAIDVGPVDMWPGFQSWGMSAVNLYYQKARWLYCHNKMYFRKTMNVSQAQQLRLFGNNFRLKLYIDGTQVGTENSTFVCPTGGCIGTVNPANLSTITAGNHTIGLEVTEAVVDGNGVLLKFYGQPTASTWGDVHLDSTWKCSPDLVTGWNTSGFNDASWINPGHDVDTWMGRGPNNAQVPYVYPRKFWYRALFNSQDATEIVLRQIPGKGLTISTVEHFNLRGQKVPASMMKSKPTSVTVRRVLNPDGTMETVRKVKVQ